MTKRKLEQRLISFSESAQDIVRIKNEIKDGWFFISLVANHGYYVGILERKVGNEGSIYIPPRKKIKFAL